MAYSLRHFPGKRQPELWPLLQGLVMESVQITGDTDTSGNEGTASLLPPAQESALPQGWGIAEEGGRCMFECPPAEEGTQSLHHPLEGVFTIRYLPTSGNYLLDSPRFAVRQ